MFAYCNNNPVNQFDEDGYWGVGTLCILGAAVGAIIDYSAQVISNYAKGMEGLDAWTDVDYGSIAGSAFSGAISAIPGAGFFAGIVDSVGSVAIEYGVNYLLDRKKVDFRSAQKDIVQNIALDLFTPQFLEVDVPKYIRHIKDEAAEQGIKGTRKLQKYLNFKQGYSVAFNLLNADTISRLVDVIS